MSKVAVYIASSEDLVGKSVVTLSLALCAKDQGRKVGYFKPFGIGHALDSKGELIDDDVVTMKEVLELTNEPNLICPVILDKNEFLKNLENESTTCKEIITSYRRLSDENDLMLIEGPPTLSTGSFLGCPVPKLASDFGARVLLVAKFKDDSIVDEILQARDYCTKWGVNLYGVILNRVPRNKIDESKNLVRRFIESNGVKVLGIIPEDKDLSSLTIQEVYDVTGGKILAGKDGMDKTFQTVLVGAMTPESAARYFRKAKNELIITGGDRTDIIFAAFETGASALILTGNLYPSVKIFPRADDLAIPIIMVPHDTYTTLQYVRNVVGRIKPKDRRRIAVARKLVRENIDWKQSIGNNAV